MKKKLWVRIFGALFLSASLQATFAQTTVDEIVDKHVEAMGGEKYKNIKSVRVESSAQIMGMDLPTSSTIVQGRGMRSETSVQGAAIVQAIDGETGWSINPMAGQSDAVAMPPEQAKMASAQLDLTGLYNYKSKGSTAELAGEEALEGAAVYVVKVAMSNGATARHYISKDTFYILRSVINTAVQGQDVEVKTHYSDFKKVDGVTFPFTTEIESPAMPGAMTMVVKSVQVNPEVDGSIFAMPKN